MKNKTFLKISAMLLVVFMSLSLFAVYASATEKKIYEEENCDVSYDDGVLTVTVNAENLGDLIEKGQFNQAALEKILPSGVYRIIDERSKASVIDFLVNLAEKEVLTYDELLKAFAGSEEVLGRYLNFDFVLPYIATDKPATKDAMERLYADGKLDALLANTAFREALIEKAGTKDIAEAVSCYSGFGQLIKDMELGDLFPMKDVWEYADIPEIIATAPGSKVNKSLRSFINNVIAGEIDEAYVNETLVFYTTELGKELDHNAAQTAILQGLPSIAELKTIGDGDTLAVYKIDTLGLPNESGETRIDMHFEVRILLKGDTSKINKNAARAANFMEYVVFDDGQISVDVSLDGRFAEDYAKILNCNEISKERKYELLGLYTADAEAFRYQLTGAKHDEALENAKVAGVRGSDKIDDRIETLRRLRDLALKFSEYETVFTNINDTYWGSGFFSIQLRDEIPLSVLADKARSRFSQIDELLAWLSKDDHIIDTVFNIQIENFFRIQYFDSNLNLLYVTYIPEGTDLSFFDDCAELQGYGEFGWVDPEGQTQTVMPDYDLNLFEKVPTTDIEVIKVWDDDDDAAGMRPDDATFTLRINGTDFLTFKLNDQGIVVDEDLARQFIDMFMRLFGSEFFEDDDDDEDDFDASAVSLLAAEDGDDQDDIAEPDQPVMPEPTPWAVVFTGMPLYLNGEPVVYEVVETPVDHYTSRVEVEDNSFVITNTYVEETTDITVTKIWDDDSNRDGARPVSINVTIFANGEEYSELVIYGLPVEISDEDTDVEDNAVLAEVSEDGNTWTYTLEGVPAFLDGAEVVWTVEEDQVEGYATRIDGLTITNTYTTETVSVSGQKVWVDENNRRNKRPENVTVLLLADGEVVARKVVTGEGNTWDFVFENLPKFADGEEIEYTVDEVECEKYAKTVDGLTITNTYIKSPDTGAAEISLFVILGTLSMAGAAVIIYRKRRTQR